MSSAVYSWLLHFKWLLLPLRLFDIRVVSEPAASNIRINGNLMRTQPILHYYCSNYSQSAWYGNIIWSSTGNTQTFWNRIKTLKQLGLFGERRLNELHSLWVAWRQWQGYKALKKEMKSSSTLSVEKNGLLRFGGKVWVVAIKVTGLLRTNGKGPWRGGEIWDQYGQHDRQSLQQWHLDKAHLMPSADL